METGRYLAAVEEGRLDEVTQTIEKMGLQVKNYEELGCLLIYGDGVEQKLEEIKAIDGVIAVDPEQWVTTAKENTPPRPNL